MKKLYLIPILFLMSSYFWSEKTQEPDCIADNLSGTPCMYSRECDCYKTCHHVSAGGKCLHYGAPCSP